ncbi:MAG TPA: glutathione S-transferase family protein [Sphingomicrobium sp.]|nr:glutathione S-transferase family protein [Sphingomicrobium sp.]
MILYGSTFSPFVRKAAAFLREKGIEFELRQTGFPDASPEFCEASPFRKMPALRDGDYCLADSSAIVHYVEARHPEPALIPAEPQERGLTVWFDEFADTIMGSCGAKMFYNRVVAPRFIGRPGEEGVADAAERDELPPILDYLEKTIPDGAEFLVGGRLTLADLAVASPFANMRHMNIALDRWPRTLAYVERILERPSFATLIAKEAAFLERTAA